MSEDYISHHGIKGQSWGVRHGPPYPVERAAGGKPKTTSVLRSKLKKSSEERKAARQVKKETKEEDAHAAFKRKVVGNPTKLYKVKDQFSRDEISEILNEIDFDRRIKDVRINEWQRRINTFKTVRDAFNTTSNLLTDSKNIYNSLADINNALIASGKSKGNPWPKVGSQDQQKKQDPQKKENT